MIAVLFIQVVISNMKTSIKDMMITFFGICYITFFLSFIPLLHGIENGKYLIDEYIGEDIKSEENLMFDDATNNDLNYDFNKAMLSVVIEVYVLFFSILYILSVMHWRW